MHFVLAINTTQVYIIYIRCSAPKEFEMLTKNGNRIAMTEAVKELAKQPFFQTLTAKGIRSLLRNNQVKGFVFIAK